MGSVSSMSEDSLFGYDADAGFQGNLFGPGHLRPYEDFSASMGSASMSKEDETVFSMLGGGHVRRGSVASIIEASPLGARKRRHRDEDDIL